MDAWVNVPHYPMIKVDLDPEGINYVVSQEPWLPLEYLPSGYNYSWIIPTLAHHYGIAYDNWTWILRTLSRKFCSFLAPGVCGTSSSKYQIDATTVQDKYDILNDKAPTFARVRYEDRAHDKIRHYMKLPNNSATVPLQTKTRLIADELAYIDRKLMIGEYPNLHRALQIIQATLNDNSSVDITTWRAANDMIDAIYEISRDRHEFDLYMRFLTPILTTIYNVIGWTGNDRHIPTGMLR